MALLLVMESLVTSHCSQVDQQCRLLNVIEKLENSQSAINDDVMELYVVKDGNLSGKNLTQKQMPKMTYVV